MWFLPEIKFTGDHQSHSAMEYEVKKEKDTAISSPQQNQWSIFQII